MTGTPTMGDAAPDLLPPWYPAMVRRRRRLLWQAAVSGAIVVGLGTALVLRADDEWSAQRQLTVLDDRRQRTDAVLGELAAQERRLATLAERAETAGRVGLPVEVARVLAEVAGHLPAAATLREVEVRTEAEQPTAVERADAARAAGASGAGGKVRGRRSLRFTLRGVTPDAADVATLLERLQSQAMFVDPLVRYGRSVEGGAGVETEFEVAFVIGLELAGGGR